jgi:RND family efflux transporter MFP subunit
MLEPTMTRPLRATAIALALALTLVTALPLTAQEAATPPAPPPAPVSVETATREQIAPLLWTPASVVSRSDARIAAEQPGRVVFVAEIGDRVAANGVLARLDDALLRLAVDEARAAHGRIAARLEYVGAQQLRLQQLAAQGTVSKAQADEAGAERSMLEQELQGAKVALAQAEHRLSRAVIRAPFAGTVAERLIAVGEYLASGAPVARLVDTENLEVQSRGPVNLAEFVAAGGSVALRHGGQEHPRRVRAVVPVGDATSRQFELRVALDDLLLPIGAALEVGLPSAAPRDVVTVPRDAVVLRPGERYVVRVDADGNAERVVVTTGAAQQDRIEVAGDIQAGDRLVVRGAERLRPGQKVEIAALAGAGAEGQLAGSR